MQPSLDSPRRTVSWNREPTDRTKPQIRNDELSTSGLIAVNGLGGIRARPFSLEKEKDREAGTVSDSNSWTDNNEEEEEEGGGGGGGERIARSLFEKRSYFSEG